MSNMVMLADKIAKIEKDSLCRAFLNDIAEDYSIAPALRNASEAVVDMVLSRYLKGIETHGVTITAETEIDGLKEGNEEIYDAAIYYKHKRLSKMELPPELIDRICSVANRLRWLAIEVTQLDIDIDAYLEDFKAT